MNENYDFSKSSLAFPNVANDAPEAPLICWECDGTCKVCNGTCQVCNGTCVACNGTCATCNCTKVL